MWRNIAANCRPRGVQQGLSDRALLVFAVVLLSIFSYACPFQLSMEYKPPVKSSVQKFYDNRYTRDNALGQSTVKRPNRDSSQSAVATGALAPTSIPPSSSPFERRMRNLIISEQERHREKAVEINHSDQEGLPANVRHIETLEQYKAVVGDERERIVAVRFYATFCKACRAVAPHYYHLASQFPDVVFVDVPVSNKNIALHQGLCVKSLPYAHIYSPTIGLVEEMSLTRKHIPQFRELLHHYVLGSCELERDQDQSGFD